MSAYPECMIITTLVGEYISYQKDAIIFSNLVQICGNDLRQDSCEGDSGGPMTVRKNNKHYLVGIVSYGNRYCGKKE